MKPKEPWKYNILKERRVNQYCLKHVPHLSEFSQDALAHWRSQLCLVVRVGMGWHRTITEHKGNMEEAQANLDRSLNSPSGILNPNPQLTESSFCLF